MEIQRLNKARRLNEWAQMVGMCRNSGMTVAAWCAKEGLSPKTYYYRLRRVCEAIPETGRRHISGLSPVSDESLLPNATHGGQHEHEESALAPQGWAVCERSETPPKESGLSIEIGKCRVKVGGEVSSEQLLTVCRVLMSLC